MSDTERYTIYCKECEQYVNLIPTEDESTFRCPICSNTYTDEQGVIDILSFREHYATYRGAVRAGLIPDPEWAEYDKEHPRG